MNIRSVQCWAKWNEYLLLLYSYSYSIHKAPVAHVPPPQHMTQGHQPSHIWSQRQMDGLWLQGTCRLHRPWPVFCASDHSQFWPFLSTRSPTADHVGTRGTCLATPIHGSRSSSLTYGPKGKWMGFDCRVKELFYLRSRIQSSMWKKFCFPGV